MTIFQIRNVKLVVRLSPLLIGCYLLGKVVQKVYEIRTSPHDSQRSLKMIAGGFYIPKVSQTNLQGEDAYFICDEEQTIGVADGVGSWAEAGIDAGAYARELMENAVMEIKSRPKTAVNPKEVLIEAHSKTKAQGSSTACIISLKGHCLHAVSLGDSGFMVIRDGKIVYESPVMLHGFNYPFQLSNDTATSDQPSAQEVLEVKVEPGDMVVVATDGLFDNLHKEEIADIVSKGKGQGLTPKQIAWVLAELARNVSMDEGRNTPFSDAARKEGHDAPGGKPDDITIIIAYIQ